MRSEILFMLVAIPRAVWAADSDPPQIEHEPCEAFTAGQDFDVVARFSDASPVFDPKVIYRTAEQGGWRHLPFVKDKDSDNFRARLKTGVATLEYFIEVFDDNGNGPARFGSPEAPIKLEPSANPPICEQTSPAPAPVPPHTPEPEPTQPPNLTPAPESQPVVPTPLEPDPLSGEAPARARTGCDADEPPLYCSGWLWGTMGFVTIAGSVAIWYFVTRDPDGQAREVALSVSAPDPRPLRARDMIR